MWKSWWVETGLCSLGIVSKVPTLGLENLDSFTLSFIHSANIFLISSMAQVLGT